MIGRPGGGRKPYRTLPGLIFQEPLVTRVLRMLLARPTGSRTTNATESRQAVFCRTYIDPNWRLIREAFQPRPDGDQLRVSGGA